MKRTLPFFLLGLLGLAGFFFPLVQPEKITTHEVIREVPATGVALPSAVAVFETSLASPISTSATSLTLTANSVRGGTTLSGFNCVTIDEGSAQAEFVCGTISGTSMTSVQRGLDPANGTSTVATLQFAHRRGANVKITDFPLITIMRNQLNGVSSFENLLFYSTSSQPCAVGSATTTICPKSYMDGLSIAGASNADLTTKGIVELATQAEAASSTSLGGTAAALVLPASMATDTPNTLTKASRVLMSNMSGYLAQAWLDLTAAFTFSGGLTSSGTTTISASSLTTNPLVINSLAYKWPATRGASSTVLMENGSGGLIFDYGSMYNFGRTSTSSGGKGTMTIAHGLIGTPRLMKFTVTNSDNLGNDTGKSYGTGVATSTSATQSATSICAGDWVANSPVIAAQEKSVAAYVISLVGSASVACDTDPGWRAQVSTVDATNITLTFDGAANDATTLNIQWEAYR